MAVIAHNFSKPFLKRKSFLYEIENIFSFSFGKKIEKQGSSKGNKISNTLFNLEIEKL